MKLPLKRFHQGEFNETVVQNPLAEGGEFTSDAFDLTLLQPLTHLTSCALPCFSIDN
jgi:hypothetical protein